MLQLTIGTNNLRLTLQNPVALASVTLRLTNQTTGKVTTATVVSPAYDGRLFTGQISVNTPPYSASSIDLTEPDNPQGFYLAELRSGTTVMASFSAYLEFEQAPQSYDPDAPYVAYDYSLNCEPATVTDGDGTVHEVSAGGSYTCLPASPPDGIAYSRPNTVRAGQVIVGDQGYQFTNGLLPYPAPPVYPETFQEVSKTNTYDNRYEAFALLKYDNAFGNKYRWTNTAGDRGRQMNQAFAQPMFHYMDDWGGAVKGYVIDHLTGLAWTAYGVNPPNGVRSTTTYSHGGQTYTRAYYTYASFANYAHGLNGETQFNLGGFTDWRVPTFEEVASISTWMTGVQMSFAWGIPGWGWDFEALQRWYVTLAQSGNPPRSGGAMWGSSVWNGALLQVNTYFNTNALPNNQFAGCFVRNHY